MDNKLVRLCPLKFDNKENMGKCEEIACMWYIGSRNSETKECAISRIAEHLDSIHFKMD